MPVDYKQRAVEQWTNQPCGPTVDAEPGSRAYAEQLIAGRREYAPWMSAALDYQGAAGLDVLDVGCGQGIDLGQYAQAGATVIGIDLTPRHLELAHQNLDALGLKASLVEGDAEQLPFPDASFDRVSSNGVLHHTPDMAAALHEARRVLRPAGRATVIVYNRDSIYFWVEQILRRGILEAGLLRRHGLRRLLADVEQGKGEPLVRVYSRRGLAKMMRDAGFSEVTVRVSPSRREDTVFGRWLPIPAGLPLGWYLIAIGSA
jgi:ubiquinone/menaquinone biosynthesis C-methylase UbiE